MIKIKARSLWQGQVGLRDKYYREAIKNKDGLEIYYKDQVMIIPAEEVDKKCRGISKEFFQDRFSNERHQLVYFDWKPEPALPSLF